MTRSISHEQNSQSGASNSGHVTFKCLQELIGYLVDMSVPYRFLDSCQTTFKDLPSLPSEPDLNGPITGQDSSHVILDQLLNHKHSSSSQVILNPPMVGEDQKEAKNITNDVITALEAHQRKTSSNSPQSAVAKTIFNNLCSNVLSDSSPILPQNSPQNSQNYSSIDSQQASLVTPDLASLNTQNMQITSHNALDGHAQCEAPPLPVQAPPTNGALSNAMPENTSLPTPDRLLTPDRAERPGSLSILHQGEGSQNGAGESAVITPQTMQNYCNAVLSTNETLV